MTNTNAIQFMSNASDDVEAACMLEGLLAQDGCLGGRVLPPCGQPDKNSWRVQAFFTDDASESELPDGMRRVFVPTGMRASMGFRS